MTNVSRRAFLGTSALTAVAVVGGCTTSSNGTVTLDPQVLADANGIVSVFLSEIPVMLSVDPTLLPAATVTSITAGLTLAQQSLKSLSTATLATAGASVLLTVEGAINAAANAIVPVLPAAAVAFPALAPIVPLVTAGVALLPAVESYVNLLIPQAAPTTVATVRAKAVAPTMTFAAARATLGVPVVK